MVKKLLVVIIALISLCSCGFDKIKTEKNIKEYQTDYSDVYAEVIELVGLKNQEFEKEINNAIEKAVEGDLIAFDSEAAQSDNNLRMGNKCVMEITWEEKYSKNDFLSIVEEKYEYTGGAHGKTVRIPKNIDISRGSEIKLKDLFSDSGYENTLNRMIDEMIKEHSEEYKDLWEKPEIKTSHQTDFYIKDGKIVIFFQPYDLSYYARGFVEFPLPLDELSGYMKEEYRRLAL